MEAFYSTFCDNVVVAKDVYHTVFSKIIENTFRCVEISLANQLNIAFPDFDMTHILDVASTKWNMGKFHPSFGIGGYCVPLAPMYVLSESAGIPAETLPTLNATVNFNVSTVDQTINMYLPKINRTAKILVIGMSSIPNVSIMNCSISVQVVTKLKERGYDVVAHDPYVPADDIEKMTNAPVLKDISNISQFDVVIMITQHEYYSAMLDSLEFKENAIVIDTFGLWRELQKNGNIQYFEVGGAI